MLHELPAFLPATSPSDMYVCMCNGITDREIRSAAELGARSLDDLSACLGIATCCRRCSDCARQVLADALADTAVCGGDD